MKPSDSGKPSEIGRCDSGQQQASVGTGMTLRRQGSLPTPLSMNGKGKLAVIMCYMVIQCTAWYGCSVFSSV